MSATLTQIRKRISKPLGNVRPAADIIRSSGDHEVADNDVSLQDQIDKLQGVVSDGFSALIAPTGDIVNPGVTIHGSPLSY